MMKKIIYSIALLGGALGTSHIQAQTVLEALEGGIPFTPSEACLELVYDKYYGDGEHNFVYCAVMGPNGKKWLNLNLGAEYAREPTPGNPNPYFNPEAYPKSNNDHLAFGSLFNYNRDADGHELVVDYQGGTTWAVQHKYPILDKKPTSETKTNRAFKEGNNDASLWETQNDPCPNGYRVMIPSDLYSQQDYTKNIENTSPAFILTHLSARSWNLMIGPTWDKNATITSDSTGISYVRTNTPTSTGNWGASAIWLKMLRSATFMTGEPLKFASPWSNDKTRLDQPVVKAPVVGTNVIQATFGGAPSYPSDIGLHATQLSEIVAAGVRCVSIQ